MGCSTSSKQQYTPASSGSVVASTATPKCDGKNGADPQDTLGHCVKFTGVSLGGTRVGEAELQLGSTVAALAQALCKDCPELDASTVALVYEGYRLAPHTQLFAAGFYPGLPAVITMSTRAESIPHPWSAEDHEGISLSEDACTAVAEGSGVAFVLGDTVISKGVHVFTLSLTDSDGTSAEADKRELHGVIDANSKKGEYSFWGINPQNSSVHAYRRGGYYQLGAPNGMEKSPERRTDITIVMRVDMHAHRLFFMLNGREVDAFNVTLPEKIRLYSQLTCRGCGVAITDYSLD